MKNHPLISVIVPVYNVEKYLPRCIDSILAQTFQDYELILVEDGSPDNCSQICDKYAQEYSMVHALHQPNSGVSAARNTGIENAVGDYIAFIDSDDYIESNYLEALFNSCSNHETALSLCQAVDVSSDGVPQKLIPLPTPSGVQERQKIFELLIVQSNFLYNTVWGKLIRRDIFENIRFPEGKIHEDVFVMHKIFDACKRISLTDQTSYFYRSNPQSIMHDSSSAHLDSIDAHLNQFDYLLERDFDSLLPTLIRRMMSLLAWYDLKQSQHTAETRKIVSRQKAEITQRYRMIDKKQISIPNKAQAFMLIHMYPFYKLLVKIKYNSVM